MSRRIWLRIKLPERELASLQQEAPDYELCQDDDNTIDPQCLRDVDGVFTEDPLPDSLVQQMPNLKWLHVTRGGVNAYLTPTVKARPIQVTGSKGIHGTVFSEFALACILALAKKLPECMEAQKQKKWQKLTPVEIEGKTLGHGRTRHRRGSVGAQGESVGSASYRDETDSNSKTYLC
jgi:phosphoglycerate dehydrogenase-like enzyme